jgi:ribonuclease BN (tRNA processing enzyme)
VCPNLIRLAQGADVLVHEVMDERWVRSLFPEPHDATEQAIISHLLASHTMIDQVGKVAEQAGVDTLVLSHYAPPDNPERRWREAKRDFSGELIVGRDLMQVGVGRRARA